MPALLLLALLALLLQPSKKATMSTIALPRVKRKQIDAHLWHTHLLKLFTSLCLRGLQVAR